VNVRVLVVVVPSVARAQGRANADSLLTGQLFAAVHNLAARLLGSALDAYVLLGTCDAWVNARAFA